MPANPDAPAPSATAAIFPLSPTRQTWLIYLLVMIAVSWACFGSLADHLLDTHDQQIFDDSLALSKDFSYFFLPADQKEVGSGRPIADLVRWLAFVAWGPNPAAYHLLLVALHTLASLLLARLAWRMGMNLEMSLVGGLLFLVNVAHFQAVHWISAIDYPLALVWGLGAALCYLAYLRQTNTTWLGLCYLMLFFVAMTHLAMLLIWPFCIYWTWLNGHDLKKPLRQLLPFALVLIPSLALITYLTASHTSTSQAFHSYTIDKIPQLLLGMGRMLLLVTSRLLTTAHWLPLEVYTQQWWEFPVGLIVLCGLGWLVWRCDSEISPWGLWSVLFSLPFLMLTESVILDMPVGPSRYLYISTAGSSLILAWLLERGDLWMRHHLRFRFFYLSSVSLILVSSFVFLRRAEALTYYTSGRNYIVAGDVELAISQLQRAIARDRDLLPLLDAYSRLCLQLLGTDQLQPVLDQALQRFPADINLNLFQSVALSMGGNLEIQKKARIRLEALIGGLEVERRRNAELAIFQGYANFGLNRTKKNDFDGAIPAYRRALEFNPDSIKLYRRLAFALLKTGQAEEAASVVLQAIRQNPSDLNNTTGFRALELRLQGKVDEAILACQSALQEHAVEDIYMLLGDCYELRGKVDDAHATYERCLSRFPNYQPAFQRLAEITKQHWDQSLIPQTLEKPNVNAPVVAEDYLGMGNLYYSQKKPEQAVAAYQEAIRRAPRDPRAYANLGTALRSLGQLAEATSAYQQALQLQPGQALIHHNLGAVQLAQGDRKAAFSSFNQALQLGSNNIESFLSLARLYLEDNQVEPAMQLYQQVLDHDLANATAPLYTQLGIQLDSLHHPDEAMAAYRKALQKDPALVAALINLGWHLYLKGNLPEAIIHYRKALALQPNSQAQFNLGLAYLRQRERELAKAAYSEGVRKYGAAEAEQIGAVQDLRDLVSQGIEVAEARHILDTYWP